MRPSMVDFRLVVQDRPYQIVVGQRPRPWATNAVSAAKWKTEAKGELEGSALPATRAAKKLTTTQKRNQRARGFPIDGAAAFFMMVNIPTGPSVHLFRKAGSFIAFMLSGFGNT